MFKNDALFFENDRKKNTYGFALDSNFNCESEKFISFKYRFVFFAVPKAASRTMIYALREYCADTEILISSKPYSELVKEHPALLGFFKFSVVRHPFTRLVSCYIDKVVDRTESKLAMLNRSGLSEMPNSFSAFVDFVCQPSQASVKPNAHWAEQVEILSSHEGELVVNAVARAENLESDINAIFDRIGLPRLVLKKIKNTRRQHLPGKSESPEKFNDRNFWSPEIEKKLLKKYERDYRFFGYRSLSDPVSVIIGAYNRASLLVTHLASMFRALRDWLVWLGRTQSELTQLYGRQTSRRLLWRHLRSLRPGDRTNDHIQALIRRMADVRVEGSATRTGWLYHDYALPERHRNVHRSNTTARLEFLSRHRPIAGLSVLDIGCSTGGLSLGLAALGARHVVGIDHDGVAISVARAVAEKYGLNQTEFLQGPLPGTPLPQADLILWLSQWMWSVKQHGLEAGKRLLFQLPAETGASVMIFESAAEDGKAAIAGCTQDDIARFLREWSPFTVVSDLGAFQDGWRLSGKERIVYECAEPRLEWQGKQALIRRVSAEAVVKTYRPEARWARVNETACLRRLAGHPNVPRLLDEGEDWLMIEWAGPRATAAAPLHQLDDIVSGLRTAGVVHRDLNPLNLHCRDGQLFLIDFEWAIIDGRMPPATPKLGLGRGFYAEAMWDDAMAASRVRAWFEKQNAQVMSEVISRPNNRQQPRER